MAKNRQKAGSADVVTGAAAVEPTEVQGRGIDDLGGGGGLFETLKPHFLKILVVVVGVGVALGAAGLYSWMGHRRDAKATALFGEVTDVLSREVKVTPPAADPAVTPPVPPPLPDPDAEPTFATQADKANAALAAIDRLRKAAGGSGVAKDASLLAAGQLYDLGKWDEAAAAYREAAAQVSPSLRGLAQEGLGYSLEAKASALPPADAARADLFKQAGLAFGDIQPDAKGFGRDLALYHQARIQGQLGDAPGAAKLLHQLVDSFPKSELVPEATSRLAVLEAK